ncbi:MAG: T9SS type A sorting domain-containing protein [Paludibacter sp.]|nr:T9SS type A sorting domain-containing protein [Paludibacter sp.]
MKKTLLFVFAALTSVGMLAVTPHGSIIKKDAPLDVVIDSKWGDGTPFSADAKVDFKAVTIGGKLWAKIVGTGYTLGPNPWSSQVRIYVPSKHEISKNNDPDYIEVDRETTTTLVTAYPYSTISQIAVCQDNNHDYFNGTAIWDYDVYSVNSGLTGDTQIPLLTKMEIGIQDGTTIQISCRASDNSGDYFYLITDVANNFYFASFTDDFTVTGLDPEISYTLSVVAVDFSGNESVGLTSGVDTSDQNEITLSQNENSIVINSPEQIRTVKLYSLNGQQIISQASSNTLVTSDLAKGVYVLKTQDIHGEINKFKVVIK